MSAELAVFHLSKTFGASKPAVDDVSFVAAAGEIVVLLGPSGCGKTTTMRSVAGLEVPTGGRIRIGDDVVSDPANGVFMRPQKRNVGMVFQSYAIWPHMTVAENVRYPLLHRGLSRAEADRRVAEALAVVSLADYAQRPATALSGGQMQRVALARSLVYQPRVLLLDEPLSNLDAKLRLRLRDDLRRIIKDAGVTALYVTHDQSEAVAVGDRVGVMRDGRLLQLATPSELYNKPVDRFVAEFTGATNVLAGRVTSVTRDSALLSIDGGAAIRAVTPSRLDVGCEATIAVRPENIRIARRTDRDSLAGDWNRMPGKVLEVRFQGVQTAYSVTTAGVGWEAIEYGSVPHYAVDQDVTLCVPVDACWAFADGPAGDRAH
jgi:iron(III) transport system ATP-binding protein